MLKSQNNFSPNPTVYNSFRYYTPSVFISKAQIFLAKIAMKQGTYGVDLLIPGIAPPLALDRGVILLHVMVIGYHLQLKESLPIRSRNDSSCPSSSGGCTVASWPSVLRPQ
jgi:hypothetical protein